MRNIQRRFTTVVTGLLAVGLLVPTADAATAHCKVIAHRGLYQGTENQPAGVRAAAKWFGAEIDASVTSDGIPIGVHDGKLGRLTGGDLTGFVDEYTYAQVTSSKVSHPFGQFRRTTRLIHAAAVTNSPILVTLNKWTRVKTAGYAASTLDTLYDAAQEHPRPHLVFFGGSGARTAMAARHPDAALFRRYEGRWSTRRIVANIKAEDIDLVALPKARHTRYTVRKVRATDPTRVTTRQIYNRAEARAAQRAGINIMQGNRPRRIAVRWCR